MSPELDASVVAGLIVAGITITLAVIYLLAIFSKKEIKNELERPDENSRRS